MKPPPGPTGDLVARSSRANTPFTSVVTKANEGIIEADVRSVDRASWDCARRIGEVIRTGEKSTKLTPNFTATASA